MASRNDIDCPGDTVMYNCSILSNSESVFLEWEISPPGMMPVRVTYGSENISEINVIRTLDMIGSVVFTRYVPPQDMGLTVADGYIESTLTITLVGVNYNGIAVTCATDIDNATEFALFNISVPLAPADFNARRLDRDLFYYTATFEWDPPPRRGVESVVDNYSLVISDQENRSYVLTPPLFIDTFQYNIEYSFTITAVNCAGSSAILVSSVQYDNIIISQSATTINGSESNGFVEVCAELTFGVLERNVTLTFTTLETGEALDGVDYSPVAVDVVFSQSQPMQCVSVTIIPDDIPEDFESFTVSLTEVGQYEYDEFLMRVNDRIGLDLRPNTTTAIIEASFISFVVATPYISGPPLRTQTLTCNITYMTAQRLGMSMPMISWDTELESVDISDQTTLTTGVLAYSNLILNDVNSSYCGVYYCSAMDHFTGLPSTGNATVIVNTAPIIQRNPMDTFVPLNAETTFTCVIDSESGSIVDITWKGPDSTLPLPVNTEQNGIITSNLTVNVTDGSYEGQLYNCSVEYQSCSMVVTSNSAMFSIILLPIITQPPLSGVFEVEDSLLLICAATTNLGTLSITWTGPMPDLQGMDVLVNENNLTNSLNIILFNYTIGGLYTCIASNEAGTDTANATIFVRPVVTPTMILASNGDEVILTCEVQSFPPNTIRWEKQSNLGMYDSVQDELDNNLIFRPIMFGNEGVYRCVASSGEFGDQVSTTTVLLAVLPEVILTETFINITYDQGDTATLQCISTGGPNNTYQWLANGTVIEDEFFENLTLSDVTAVGGGMYTCIVSNLAGNDTASTFVFIYPYIVSDPLSKRVSTGSTVVLICDVEAFPNPEYLWLRLDGRNIGNLVSTNESSLNISSIEYGDEGGYYCIASARGRSVTTRAAVLTVAPGDVNVTVDDVAARGDNVTFTCSNNGGPNNTYQWLMDNNMLPEENSPILYLTLVEVTSGGDYTCLIANIAGNDSSSVTLYIEPYITTFPMGFLEVELSDPATFICNADGFPAPVANWIKVAGQMNGTIASMTGNLSFPSVTAEDNGTYVCQASARTPVGRQLQTAFTTDSTLIVNCRPPLYPVNGNLGNYTSQRVGADVSYWCVAGFRPSAVFVSICANTSMWTPAPQDHICMFVTADVTLTPLPPNVSRPDIVCPGDRISYNCSILSNSENVHLIWRITLPDLVSYSITYDRYSDTFYMNNTGDVITTFLTNFTDDTYIESTLELILSNFSLNQTRLECLILGLDSDTVYVDVNSSGPHTPTGFNITEEYYTMMNVTVTFEWDPPQGSGPEAIVDYYRISITPPPLFPNTTIWNATLNYNQTYTANITAINCVGESGTLLLPFSFEYVNCGDPLLPTNGSLGDYEHTREGASVSYYCNSGYRPSEVRTTVCTNSKRWTPLPEEHLCTLVESSVTIVPLERNVSRRDIECPGDTIPYNCSVQSNSENVQLTWELTFTDQTILNITYSNANASIVNDLGMEITTILTEYVEDQFIESTIIFTVLQGVLLNGTTLRCKSASLDGSTLNVFVNTTEPLMPTGLSITREYYMVQDTTVTFEWNPPQGRGPEVIVDYYRITVTLNPRPLSHNISTLISSLMWNVTLQYNVMYTVNITAINCAGESGTLVLTGIEYVNCGDPDPPVNGSLETVLHTREGAIVTFWCNQGYVPSLVKTATCTDEALWIPAPDRHNCTLVEAFSTLTELERNVSRVDIECSGDSITYNCSILSNSENVNLMWFVTIPGEETLNITYDKTSSLERVDYLGMNITTTLTEFVDEEYIESLAVLTVLDYPNVNGTVLECRSAELDNEIADMYINRSVPALPINFNISAQNDTLFNTTITFRWDPPPGSGVQTIVDKYIFSVYPQPLSHTTSNFVYSEAVDVTLEYNLEYTATLVAVNCAGKSDPPVLLPDVEFIDCGIPEPPLNGYLSDYPKTKENVTVTFQCNVDYVPSLTLITTCDSQGLWEPDPAEHNCTLVAAYVTLVLLEQDMMSAEIDCPGDTITYKCSIESNTEDLYLVWSVLYPDYSLLEMSYDHNSPLGIMDYLEMNVTTSLLDYNRLDGYIESTLTLTVLNINTDGTIVECEIRDLDDENVTILINMSEPLPPTNLHVSATYENSLDVNVYFEWEPPLGEGPEFIVESYIFSIAPVSDSTYYLTKDIYSTMSNVSLEYNENFTVSVTSVNCAGQSEPLSIANISFANCGAPMAPTNGSLGEYARTTEGATVSFVCNRNFVPTSRITSVCTREAVWDPAPEEHRCRENSCGVPLPPIYGSIASYSGTAPGNTVTFICDKFFVPTMIMVGVCTNEFVWNPSPENHTCSVDERRTDPVRIRIGGILAGILPLLGIVYIILVISAFVYLYIRTARHVIKVSPYSVENKVSQASVEELKSSPSALTI